MHAQSASSLHEHGDVQAGHTQAPYGIATLLLFSAYILLGSQLVEKPKPYTTQPLPWALGESLLAYYYYWWQVALRVYNVSIVAALSCALPAEVAHARVDLTCRQSAHHSSSACQIQTLTMRAGSYNRWATN